MDCKNLLINAGMKMFDSSLTVETWGNISYRDPASGKIYVTPSGMDYCSCTPDDIVVYSLDGGHLEGKRKPTMELELHLSVLRARPEINAVLHTHPIYSMVFACLGWEIPPVMDESAETLGGTVNVAQYALPGSDELAANCVRALGKDGYACLLQSHGAVCLGETMEDAFRTANVLEISAQVYHMAKQLGEPKPISAENIASMRDHFKNKYGQR